MKCPKCELEMQKGFLPVVRGRLYWAPEEERVPWNIVKKPKGSVTLSEFTVTTPKQVEAHYCVSCKMVIIPLD
ncbi:hypothetical protein BK010_00515 [Tenericutes bacterium MO-XQ]|nr:hypothetical protein BK010_00515 [Tenericutes bacterium MO-XQ]